MFLPRHAEPPYQTVLYMPGSAAFLIRSSENLAEMSMVEFVPRSGRALVYPVYKGSYERHMEGRPAGLARRQWTIWLTQDLQRTVDYVQSRDDLRNDALGYLGLSLGAAIAVPIALEHRFAALGLVGGAFDPQWRSLVPPEIAPWNYASRITNARDAEQRPARLAVTIRLATAVLLLSPVSAEWARGAGYVHGEAAVFARQTRLSAFDVATDPYALVDVSGGVAPRLLGRVLHVDLAVRNLMNQAYRSSSAGTRSSRWITAGT